MKNIVLIGMPGCGKTTLGKMLAARLKVDFYDADDVLEAREPYTIKEFFAQGENVFREAEQRTSSAQRACRLTKKRAALFLSTVRRKRL